MKIRLLSAAFFMGFIPVMIFAQWSAQEVPGPQCIYFISGHSHNLEYFDTPGKHFLVIGGGGGIAQPLFSFDQQRPKDMLNQDDKPLYFYLIIEKNGNSLKLIAKGFKRDFGFFEFDSGNHRSGEN